MAYTAAALVAAGFAGAWWLGAFDREPAPGEVKPATPAATTPATPAATTPATPAATTPATPAATTPGAPPADETAELIPTFPADFTFGGSKKPSVEHLAFPAIVTEPVSKPDSPLKQTVADLATGLKTSVATSFAHVKELYEDFLARNKRIPVNQLLTDKKMQVLFTRDISAALAALARSEIKILFSLNRYNAHVNNFTDAFNKSDLVNSAKYANLISQFENDVANEKGAYDISYDAAEQSLEDRLKALLRMGEFWRAHISDIVSAARSRTNLPQGVYSTLARAQAALNAAHEANKYEKPISAEKYREIAEEYANFVKFLKPNNTRDEIVKLGFQRGPFDKLDEIDQ